MRLCRKVCHDYVDSPEVFLVVGEGMEAIGLSEKTLFETLAGSDPLAELPEFFLCRQGAVKNRLDDNVIYPLSA